MASNLLCLPRWGYDMIYKVSSSIFLFASAVLAQHALMPGTLASALGPASDSEASSTSFIPSSSSSSDARQPITAQERIDWVVKGTIGPEGVMGELVGAGLGTWDNVPRTYGTHWQGFGNRLGMGVAGNAVSNTMEAGLGAVWGEDPRYVRDPGAPFSHRMGHAIKMTFMSHNREGDETLAYARFIAIPGSNFLSNAWRVDGDNSIGRATIRTGLGFLGRMGDNTFEEFWPDLKQRVFHHSGQ
jgi:hypothetical protein